MEQIPSDARDFKNHDPNTIRIETVKATKSGNFVTMKGLLTNTGNTGLTHLHVHTSWYDSNMNLIGFNDGHTSIYSSFSSQYRPSDNVEPGSVCYRDKRSVNFCSIMLYAQKQDKTNTNALSILINFLLFQISNILVIFNNPYSLVKVRGIFPFLS